MTARSTSKKQTQALTDLAHTFYALKDVVRLEMLSVLAQRECTVNELAEALDKSQPLMSWHLRRLKAAGVVKIRRSGREVYCSLDREVVQQHQQAFRDLIGLP
jgi:ArsR family transcriptional regulator, arsenate/arsenite/antimonite-responsive transcriptional repressor